MKLFLSLAISLLFLSSAYSDDLLVNSSGLDGSYTTISAAVQAASAGDRILISPQIMPYQEDTLVIDKDLTLMPYANNSFVSFEGNMQLTLDSIANFTLIGFRGDFNFENLFSVFNDTSRNSLSVINIIDCMISKIHMDQPKTSLYLSYSKTYQVAFSHGDIIGNHIGNLYFGNFDYNSPVVSSVISANHAFNNGILQEPNYSAFWPNSGVEEYNGNYVNTTDNALNSTWFITECELFENYIPFGNVDVYSDTCNIIANYFHSNYNSTTLFNLDFPFNISNNFFSSSGGSNFIYLTCPTSKGTNQCVNNNRSKIELYLSYCVATSIFNFSDVTIEHLNNYDDSRISIISPNNISGTHYSSLPVSKNSIKAYNAQAWLNSSGDGISGPDFEDLMWNVGPNNTNSNENPNPSLKYLNLDLTPNIVGIDGGSHAWINYHGTEDVQAESTLQDVVDALFQSAIDPTGYSDFGYDVPDIESVVSKQAGRMPTGSKARITYLNLPTQIFDPANIRVKAKAVHGN